MTQSLRGSKRSARRIAILNPRIINLFQRVQVFGVPPWKNKIAKADITALPEVRGAADLHDLHAGFSHRSDAVAATKVGSQIRREAFFQRASFMLRANSSAV